MRAFRTRGGPRLADPCDGRLSRTVSGSRGVRFLLATRLDGPPRGQEGPKQLGRRAGHAESVDGYNSRMPASVRKAALVLDLFSVERPDWGPTEVADELGIAKSTAHALLAELASVGLIERLPCGRYRLGWRTVHLARTMLATSGYGEVVTRTARRLASHFGETVPCRGMGPRPRPVRRQRAPAARRSSTGSGGRRGPHAARHGAAGRSRR